MKAKNERLIIKIPQLTGEEDGFRLSFPLQGASAPELHFHFRNVERSFLCETLEPALVALLIPAMLEGRDLHLAGPVSPELWFRMQHYLIPLIRAIIPAARDIAIIAEEFRPQAPRTDGAVLTGLSNGVDSMHVCANHLGLDQPAGMRLTHFIFHDVGSHGAAGDPMTKVRARRRLEQSQESSGAMGLPLIAASSNMGDFHTLPYHQTHTLRSAAVAFALSGGVSRFLYASASPYPSIHVRKSHTIAPFDAITLPLLRSESLECFSVGAACTRVQKTAQLADYPYAQRFLNVCVTDHSNCSRCWKCARTLFTLDLLGAAGNFGEVFDLDAYRKIRSRFVSHVLASAPVTALSRELTDLMRERGFHPSPAERARALAYAPLLRLAYRRGRPFSSAYLRLTGFSATF